MKITKDDVLNHLRESFNMKPTLNDGYDRWGRAEKTEYTYFMKPGNDGVIRDSMGDAVELDTTLSDAGVTWRFLETTGRSCDTAENNRFSKITEFTLPGGETFFVGASFSSDSWNGGSNYYDTSGSIGEVQRREKVVHYFE